MKKSKSLKLTLAFLFLTFLIFLVCFNFRYHLFLKYSLVFSDIEKIPLLPEVDNISYRNLGNLQSFEYGSIVFKLPGDFKFHEKYPAKNVLTNGRVNLMFDEIIDVREHLEILANENKLKLGLKNYPKFCLDCYRFNQNMFKWTLTKKEAKYFLVLLANKMVMQMSGDNEIRYFLNNNIEGLIVFSNNYKMASIKWQKKDCFTGGLINIFNNQSSLDSGFVDQFCQSLEFRKSVAIDCAGSQ